MCHLRCLCVTAQRPRDLSVYQLIGRNETATETSQVTHFGYLGFIIFWCMSVLQLRNCGFDNILRKIQSKPANFWNLTLLCMVFYYSATENTSNSTVFGCVAKLCRKSRPFLAQFYVANHAVLVTHFNPPKSGW